MPDTVRAAERFALISVQSGKYVRAGGGRESQLGAVSDRIANWETFERVPLDGNLVAIRSAQSGKFVRAGGGPNSLLGAVSDRVAGWETFEWIDLGGSRIALRSAQNGKFVRAGVGHESLLAAVSDRVAAWEIFTHVVVPSNVDIIQPAPVDVTPSPADEPRQQAQQPSPGSGLAPELQVILDVHNSHRVTHCVPALIWSPTLAAQAQAWADQCNFVHSSSGYGENLWMGTAGHYTPAQVVDSWYAEIASYQYSQPGFSASIGHFTQIVWKSSTQLGCGRATCQGHDLWVCNYAPPGNYQGQFVQNVLPPC